MPSAAASHKHAVRITDQPQTHRESCGDPGSKRGTSVDFIVNEDDRPALGEIIAIG